eukprot:363865-Chlamydomonas_euryale.AAC.18
MWHAYNLIREGDNVTATTLRKVAKDSGVGAESERIKLKLTVQVSRTGRRGRKGASTCPCIHPSIRPSISSHVLPTSQPVSQPASHSDI